MSFQNTPCTNNSTSNNNESPQGYFPNTSYRSSSVRGACGYNSTTFENGIKYVHELPYFERKEICLIFDEHNQWETLGGGLMNFNSSELSEFGRAFYRNSSPTDALLTAWGNQNHTVLELFILFAKLGNFRAMKVISRFVDSKYHKYIEDQDVNATQELTQLRQRVVESPEGKSNYHPEKSRVSPDPSKKDDVPGIKNIAGNEIDVSNLSLPQIPYEELLLATGDWERRNILGKGGFGTVFKGVWKHTAVAIKRMEQRSNQAYVESQMKQSLGELKFLNSYRHDNILPLYGYCLTGEYPCLVYQYMNNGSLEDRLLCRQKTAPLAWSTRFQIVRGVACGIQFLHSIGTKPLIHGDIKSANILLDKNFEAKIGDFGLARELNKDTGGASYVKVSRVHGTRPYLPDEYLRSKKLSTKVDTFSFGIVLFEVATGQRAYEEKRRKKFLKDIVEESEGNFEPLRDPKGGSECSDVFWIFIKVGKNCTARIAKERPELTQVLKSFDSNMSMSQASSIRTNSTHVTGLPLLFDSRPASLHIPQSSSNQRLSPELRAGSPHRATGVPIVSTTTSVATNKSGGPETSTGSIRRSPIVFPPSPNLSHKAQPKRSECSSNSGGNVVAAVPADPEDKQETSFLPLVINQNKEEQEVPLIDLLSNNESIVTDDNGPDTVIPLITELGIKDT